MYCTIRIGNSMGKAQHSPPHPPVQKFSKLLQKSCGIKVLLAYWQTKYNNSWLLFSYLLSQNVAKNLALCSENLQLCTMIKKLWNFKVQKMGQNFVCEECTFCKFNHKIALMTLAFFKFSVSILRHSNW